MIAINVADVVELFRRKARWKAVGLTSWPYALICVIVESINQAHAREDIARQNAKIAGFPFGPGGWGNRPAIATMMGAQVNGQHANLTKYEKRIDELIAQVNGQHANLTKYEEQIANHEASHKSTLSYYMNLLVDANEQIAQLRQGHENDMRILAEHRELISKLSAEKQPRAGWEQEVNAAVAASTRYQQQLSKEEASHQVTIAQLADARESGGRYAKIADKRTEELAKERAEHNMTCTQLAHAELRIKELTATDEKSTRASFEMMRERDAARAQAMDARKIINEDTQRIAQLQESMRALHDTVVRQAEALDNLPRIEQANRDLRDEADKRIDQVCELTAEVKRLQGYTTVREWELMHAEICKALGVKRAPVGTHALCLNAITTLNRKAHHLGLYIAAVNGAMPELPKEPA